MNPRAKNLFFEGRDCIIPFFEVAFVERNTMQVPDTTGSQSYSIKPNYVTAYSGLRIILKSSRWNFEHDCWDNNAYLTEDEKQRFLDEWSSYILTLEERRFPLVEITDLFYE